MEEPLSLLENLIKYSTVYHMLMFIDSFSLYSLRAQYGENTLRNAVHGSSNKEHANKTIEMIFGEVEFGPDGSVKEGMCISARNNFWKCPAETAGQNNIWPASCEFCLDEQVSQICIVPIYVLWDIVVIHSAMATLD